MVTIPFNRPCFEGQELAYVTDALSRGHLSGDGPYTQKCHALLERELGVTKALLTTSCTDALEMCALLLDIQPGDEVIVPSFTFVSTVNAFALRGARPVFVDIRPDTLNLDERKVAERITARTRAIVPVHYAGVGCELDALVSHGVPVVEDNAHGLFATYRQKPLGSFGALATQSFHETKNFSCGEGGALLINDARLVERAEIIREKGTNRSRFYRGLVDRYTWVDLGSSFLPSEVLAALLFAQLEAKDRVQGKRQAVWERYHAGLSAWAAANQVGVPFVPAHCQQAFQMYYLLLPSLEARDRLQTHLRERRIGSAFHYLPLHRSEMGRTLAGDSDCPVTDDVSARLLRLPFYNDLSEADQAQVIAAVEDFRV